MAKRITFFICALLMAMPVDSRAQDANPFPIRAPQQIYSGAVVGGNLNMQSTGGGSGTAPAPKPVVHKPLILVKVRVVEVARNNGLAVSSVLDYVSRENVEASLTSGVPLNSDGTNGFENVRGKTRFGVPGLINGLPGDLGAGMLVNLTSEHINWVASLLATELNADLITAPQVTTLDGETVTFSAGAEIPFEIGFNTIQQNTNTVQQFSYVPVGTYIKVTPQIVNRGMIEEFSPVTTTEVFNWQDLLWRWANSPELEHLRLAADKQIHNAVLLKLENLAFDSPEVTNAATDENIRQLAIDSLNNLLKTKWHDGRTINRSFLSELFPGTLGTVGSICGWEAEDCVIDLNINVALSDGAFDPQTQTSIKDNVRNILNRVQVKSGHGVVMGGLISAEDTETVAKTPILGDIPVVGALFRSKFTERRRTETLVFVEAHVLPDVSVSAREQTAHDFALGQGDLTYELNCADLIRGMDSAGLMGKYLPVPSDHEKDYWHCYHQTRAKETKRRVITEFRDILK